jgi:FkbM family methyltransferase
MSAWLQRRVADLQLARDFALARSRIATMQQGVAAGARFCAGASNRDYESGRNELPVQQALAGVLHSGGVFYDIGANVGFFSVIASRLVGASGRVVAFEPVPRNLAYVRLNCRINRCSNVRVVEAAVSDRSGEGTLMLARFAGGAALSVAGPPPDFLREMRVTTVALDDWLAAQGGPRPDVVKIDVEGAELQALQGMRRILAELRPRILLEVDGADRDQLMARRDSCTAFLAAQGYGFSDLPPSYADARWHVQHLLAHPVGRP